MSVTDPIADMLNRIRNAGGARLDVVEVGHSALKVAVARILKEEGYIGDFVAETEGTDKRLRLFLKYDAQRQPVIRGLRRVSKSGLRRYVKTGAIPRVLGGLGMSIVSTPAGVLTDRAARERHVGGEVLCQVW